MHKPHNPSDVPKPAGAYTQGIEVKPNTRWLHISGQIGVSPDGQTAKGAAAQAEQAWANIANMLKAAGMGMNDLVKITTFVCNAADIPAVRAARDKYIAGALPASTLVVVAGLASKDWLVEIEAVAAKA